MRSMLLPALAPAAAAAAATQDCLVKPWPHSIQRLAAAFNGGGNLDPADDAIEATLTLCGRAHDFSAYQLSFDVLPPLYAAADRDGDGDVDRRDFCAETRDGFAALQGGRPVGLGTATTVPGAGGAPDLVRFRVPVDALAPGLPRDGATMVALWAETRLVGATLPVSLPFLHVRELVDRLPAPGASDICFLPQAPAEVVEVVLADPPPAACPAGCAGAIAQFAAAHFANGPGGDQDCFYDTARSAGTVELDFIPEKSSLLVGAGRCFVELGGQVLENSAPSAAEQAACAPPAAAAATAITGRSCDISP